MLLLVTEWVRGITVTGPLWGRRGVVGACLSSGEASWGSRGLLSVTTPGFPFNSSWLTHACPLARNCYSWGKSQTNGGLPRPGRTSRGGLAGGHLGLMVRVSGCRPSVGV